MAALCSFCQRGALGLPLYRCSRYLFLSWNLLLKFNFTSVNTVRSESVDFLYLISLGQRVCIFFFYLLYFFMHAYFLPAVSWQKNQKLSGFLFHLLAYITQHPPTELTAWNLGEAFFFSPPSLLTEQAPSGSCSCPHS